MIYTNHIKLACRLLLGIFLMTTQAALAQQHQGQRPDKEAPCASELLTAEESDNYSKWAMLERGQVEQRAVAGQNVPVMFHIVQNTNGDGVTAEQAEQALEWANEKFAASGIQLYQCSPPNIIVSNFWYNTEFMYEWENECGADTPEYDFDAAFHVPNVVNIYCVNTNGWSWASFPWRRESRCHDWVILHQSHVNSQWLLAHELGHYFGLLHTFQDDNENVTRNFFDPCFNCPTAGDRLCDTPADYHRSSEWQPGCDPDDEFDACGVLLTPDGLNLMSYSNSDCPAEDKYFTAGQNNRMNFYLDTQRDYLNCQHDCVASYNLGGVHAVSRTYRAWDFIRSTASLNPSIELEYQAGDYILLRPGFHAPEGAHFTARILDCVDDSGAAASAIGGEGEKSPEPPVSGRGALPSSFRAYPSPFSDRLVVAFSVAQNEPVAITVTDIAGKQHRQVIAKGLEGLGLQTMEVETSGLPPGVYFVTLSGEGPPQTVKVVKVE